jgi:hypothetical protein
VYLLYDKVYRADILAHAYALSKEHGGAPGVDGVTFEDIAGSGVERWRAAVQEARREKTYRPQPVRRVLIPKPGGGERPLGIPTIRDRVVQTAAMLILQPIFEADMEPTAYGYRPGRGAQEAVQEVHRALCAGYTEVVDADGSQYCDTIPHAALMKSVARRISDGKLLRLGKRWLKAPVAESAAGGGWSVSFLGYTFGPMRYRKDGHWDLGAAPAKEAVQRVKGGIRRILRPGNQAPGDVVVRELNHLLRGWANYFGYGTRYLAYRAVDNYAYERARHFLRRRHKVPTRGARRFSREVVFEERGGLRLRRLHLGSPAHAEV